MNTKRSLQNHVRGWLPKETTLSATMTVQMAIMFEREKAYRRKVASVLLGISGVLFGLAAAGYAYFCFSKIGVTAFDASIYAVIMCIFVLGILWLVAFNLKRILQIFAKELKA